MRVPFGVGPPEEFAGTVVGGELADPLVLGAVELVLELVLLPPIDSVLAAC
jgi:hypothetical protein